MNGKKFKNTGLITLKLIVIMAVIFSVSSLVSAASESPFHGHWFAIDVDGSDIRLTIAGKPDDPLQITWTESYISFCNGEPGIVRGVGWINEENPFLLEADLHLKCFKTDKSFDFHQTWRYHPDTDMLSSIWNGIITIWHRPGRLPEAPPDLNLRVNYGDDWVESFYENGHTAWVTLTDSSGEVVKATTEVITEPKEYWDWESGFQTLDSIWYDGAGNPMDNPPNIQPRDWIFGWVDNGASAKVQIGEIHGVVDLTTDSIQGNILANWYAANVDVECFPWGAPEPAEMKFDSVLPDGVDPYYCSWAGEWDIQSEQPVGVGYFGPDGHWVANVLRNPRFTVFPEWDWLEGWEWPEGVSVNASVAGKAECYGEGTPGYNEDNPWSTFVPIDFPEDCDLSEGDIVTLSNGDVSISHTIQNLAISNVDKITDTITGTTYIGAELQVWAHGYDESTLKFTTEDTTWLADFGSIGFDLVEGMCGRSEIRDGLGNGTAVDWCIPNPRFTIFPESEWFDGMDWPDGVPVSITVDEKEVCTTEGTSADYFFNGGFPEGCDIEIGDVINFDDGITSRTHTVKNLIVTAVDPALDLVSGTAEIESVVKVWVHGFDETEMHLYAEDGAWLADFAEIGFDLVEGMGGRAEITDNIGNATAVDWQIPMPQFVAYMTTNIEGYDWPMGDLISLNINEGEYTAFEESEQRPEFPEGTTRVMFELWRDEFELEAGDYIVMTDLDTGFTKEHQVPDLRVTDINMVSNIISGLYDPGLNFRIWLEGKEPINVEFFENSWTATFEEIPEGGMGTIHQDDFDLDATSVDFWVPNPEIRAWPVSQRVEGYRWPVGVNIALSIYDPISGVTYTDIQQAEGDPDSSVVVFALTDFELEPEQEITMSTDQIIKTHTVLPVSITNADPELELVEGIASAEARIILCVYNGGCEPPAEIFVNTSGYWQIDYSGWFDLQSGFDMDATEFDLDGDGTSFYYLISAP